MWTMWNAPSDRDYYDSLAPQCTAPEEEEYVSADYPDDCLSVPVKDDDETESDTDSFRVYEDDEARSVIAEWIDEGNPEEDDIPW